MELRFPGLDGGQEQGLNDAGVEAFQGSIGQYVVRECAQNSGDAHVAQGDKVRVDFDISTWNTKSIPCLDQILTALRACRDYWKHDNKTRKFFDRALGELKYPQVRMLRIGDYGTTGLTGSDTDRKGGWYALVKSQGVSVKEDTAGGSYGIGKSSPFAASRFRTVFYSTRTVKDEVAFQGVCRLVTHKNSTGNTTQAVGFVGGYQPGDQGGDPLFTAIRDPDAMPQGFLRDEPGTDIFIPGYFTAESNWERELVISILNSFWPAIYRGSMEFRVGDRSITQDNVGALINGLRGAPDFQAHLYYGAVASEKHAELEKELETVGRCKLFLSTEGDDLPKKVCLIRRAGMIIDDYGPHNIRIPYTGLFVCESSEGNRLLREMEPPRHDKWDPKRIEGPAGRMAIKEIREWIREEVRKLNPTFQGDSFNEDDLSRYLPELEAQGEAAGGDSSEPGTEPGFYGTPSAKAPEMQAIPVEHSPGGADTAGAGSGDGTEPGGDTGPPDPVGGDGKNTGGRVRRRGGGGRSGAPAVMMRSYSSGLGGDEYVMILRSKEDYSGAVRIIAAGDDEADDDIELGSCTVDGESQELPISGNRITDVTVLASQPLRLRLRLKRPQRVSLVLGAQ